MNVIDKIIDWLDAFDKFKKRIISWYYLKDTQTSLSIILFIGIILAIFYSMSTAGFPWYWSLIVLFFISIGGIYLIVLFSRKERKAKRTTRTAQVETIGLDFNKVVLDNVYYVLRGFDKIDTDKTGIDNFHSVLTQRFKDTDSEIHFIAMSWVELRYVLEKFKEKCGVEYSTFEKSNKLFLEGKPVTAKKLSNNGLRNNPDKHFIDKIDNCFPRKKGC